MGTALKSFGFQSDEGDKSYMEMRPEHALCSDYRRKEGRRVSLERLLSQSRVRW